MQATRSIRTTAVGLLVAASFLGACGEASTNSTTNVASPGDLTAASDIARPENKPVLNVSGAISKWNGPKGLKLDIETIEQMPSAEATVYEPFVKRDVSFSGVILKDFMDVVGVDPHAKSLFMTALDDYTVDLPMSQLDPSKVMLATREAGKPIKLRAGGPVRIIFLTEDVLGSNPDMWIWSVKHIEVKK